MRVFSPDLLECNRQIIGSKQKLQYNVRDLRNVNHNRAESLYCHSVISSHTTKFNNFNKGTVKSLVCNTNKNNGEKSQTINHFSHCLKSGI